MITKSSKSKSKVGQLSLIPLSPLEEVLILFQKYNHYSLRKLKPTLELKLKDVPEEVMKEALIIYQKKAYEGQKAPHPNYYITICINSQRKIPQKKKPEDENESFSLPLGRMI